MADKSFLTWPFFENRHRELAENLESWCVKNLPADHHDVDAACRELVQKLGRDGWLKPTAVDTDNPGPLDVRTLCITRETLARHDGLADFAFAMQGLGTGALSLFGTPQQQQWLAKTRAGKAISAFALSEPRSGSDVANTEMTATRDGDAYVLTGEKTWISNGGIADFYVVFARSDAQSRGAKGISAFVVDADAPGFSVAERIEVIAPHPLARIKFDDARVPATRLLGEEGAGFKLAMQTLDIFRSSVAAAALGFARRALDEALARAKSRPMFGATLGDLQLTQAAIGEMATMIDSAALLTYRAAWQRDVAGERATREAAMAKMTATENAQAVIDRALQMFGGQGVKSGETVEKLYREIRALRIYEGATEVQKLIIARETMKG